MQILKRMFGQTTACHQEPASPKEVFDRARSQAALTSPRQVVLVRPDLSLLALACPAADTIHRDVISQMESIVPSSTSRNIAVITRTGFVPDGSRAEVGSPTWTAIGKTIPFFGILNGLACIGHAVWIFDATADIGTACRDADILIVDSAAADHVPEAALDAARQAMHSSTIFIHDRATFRLRPITQELQPGANWEAVFDKARLRTREGDHLRIVLVLPDQSLLCLPCIPRKAMTADHLAQAHRLIPDGASRRIAVIAPTRLIPDPSDNVGSAAVAQLRAAGRTIPFFGLLLNLASAGNPLWIFESNRETVVPGCRGADLLFIDSMLADKITTRQLDEAASAMRSANIAVYDRTSRKIALLRHIGKSKDKLEFRD